MEMIVICRGCGDRFTTNNYIGHGMCPDCYTDIQLHDAFAHRGGREVQLRFPKPQRCVEVVDVDPAYADMRGW